MKKILYSELNQIDKQLFKGCVLTTGSFDGIHLGHQAIFKQMETLALKNNAVKVVITFFIHPRNILDKKNSIKVLNTFEEKYSFIKQNKIDYLICLDFSTELAEMDGANFIEHFLINYFHPSAIVIGHNHKFGKNRAGDMGLLKSLEKKFKYITYEVPEYVLQSQQVSSTKIRNFLLTGKIEQANLLLGHTYSFAGIVVKGKQLGRTINFPTANILVPLEKLIPCNGVYAVDVLINLYPQKIFKGMMNIGYNPTVSTENNLSIEVNILNFDKSEELYGKQIRVFVKTKLRDEKKFNDIKALAEQLNIDRQRALEF